MKRVALVLIILTVASPALQAQYFFYDDRYYDGNVLVEIGTGIGGMNALTDLGGKKGDGRGFVKDLNLKNTKPAFVSIFNSHLPECRCISPGIYSR
ncbi:MAG: hypothetical protein HC867_04965 [Bacteroidia bacterium]|nr:hypothetical protein [Bacteroidia bacterium]